jgi:dCMP deaminase
MATIHAEQNVIADCAKRGVSCKDATVYITHYPCINCMKILSASQVKEISYINDYRNDELVEYFSNISKIPIRKI